MTAARCSRVDGRVLRPVGSASTIRAILDWPTCERMRKAGHKPTRIARVPAPSRPPPTAVYTLRPIGAADSELAYTISREAMREYVEQTWGSWIEAEQRERHAQAFRPGTQDFIVVRDEVLGLRHIEWRQTHLYLARLYLRPAAQGRGLGSADLRDLQQQARALGRSIELQVLKVNIGAQRFYGRHGFQQVGERERHWLLRAGSRAVVARITECCPSPAPIVGDEPDTIAGMALELPTAGALLDAA